MEFIKGKWYKNLGSDKRWISKFHHIGNPYEFWHTEFISPNKGYGTGMDWLWYLTDVEECTQEELNSLLPEGHPDKIIELPEEYIVEVNSNSSAVELLFRYYYKYESSIGNWNFKYFICKKSIKQSNNRAGGDAIEDYIKDKYKHLPVFTYEQWLKLKDNKNMKVEAPKTFLVKGDSKHLLKACLDEILELGYTKSPGYITREIPNKFFCNNIKYPTRIDEYKNIFINESLSSEDRKLTFTLPQDYTKAIEYAKEAINSPYWNQPKVKKMKFGEMEVEVIPGLGYVQIAEGRIYKEDLKKVIDHLKERPKILGYKVEFPDVPTTAHKLKFGCKIGKISELYSIYEII